MLATPPAPRPHKQSGTVSVPLELLAEKPKINVSGGDESKFPPSWDYFQRPLHVLGWGVCLFCLMH